MAHIPVYNATELIENAFATKYRAIVSSKNIDALLLASDMFTQGSINLSAEIRKGPTTNFNFIYGDIFSQYMLFESYDCLYSYFKHIKDYEKAVINMNKAINILKKIHTLKEHIFSDNLKRHESYNSLAAAFLSTNIEYDFISYQGRVPEMEALIYLRSENYLEASKKYHECFSHFKELKMFVTEKRSLVGEQRYLNVQLNNFILSVNYSQVLIGAYAQNSYEKNSNYFLSIITNLTNAIDSAEQIILLNNIDPQYSNGLKTLKDNLKGVLENNKRWWIEVLDKYRDDRFILSILRQIDNEFFVEVSAKIPKEKPDKYVLVFIVHGFNTRGDWKNTLSTLLSNSTSKTRFIPIAWDYGEFKAKILSKNERKSVIYNFKSFFNVQTSIYSHYNETAVVAHSFGTYISSVNVVKFPEVNFDKIIYCGSVLRKDFDWLYVHTKKPNVKVLFEIHEKDNALKLASLYSKIPCGKWIGDSGAKGFNKNYNFISIDSYKYSDHSDMFGLRHMKTKWVPFLDS